MEKNKCDADREFEMMEKLEEELYSWIEKGAKGGIPAVNIVELLIKYSVSLSANFYRGKRNFREHIRNGYEHYLKCNHEENK